MHRDPAPKSRQVVAAISIAASLALPAPAHACGFHNYLPDMTVVDRLLASDDVVLARSDPENPFRFKAVAAIEGQLEWVEIPQLADSGTRRRLAANPSDTVLFALDAPYGPWRRLAYVDAAYRPVLDDIIARLPAWESGDLRDRFQMFADLHAHPAREIHGLALAELDRAPYGVLRSLDLAPDALSIIPDLHRFSDYHFLPIRLLLLGLSGDDAARDVLVRGVESQSTGYSTSTLGAYATALVELDGEAGVAYLGNLLVREDLSADAEESLVEALAIHAESGEIRTRAAVQDTVETVVAARPTLAASVVRQFGIRGDYSHATLLDGLRRGGAFTSVADLFAIGQYVALAQQPESARSSHSLLPAPAGEEEG